VRFEQANFVDYLRSAVLVIGTALGFFHLAAPARGQAGVSPEVIARVDAQAAAEFAKDQIGSVTVGLVSGSKLTWTKSYGFADMERKIPASADTVYRIGSITKQFTGLMLLQLVQAEKVHLSDPVAKYFPEVDHIPKRFPDAPPITLVQLATHTAGLAREPGDLATYLKGPVSDWEKVLIAALPHANYLYEPGTQFSYSNLGYAVLGAALGRAAGQPYVDYVKQHILAPLGMTHTSFEPNDQMRVNLARGYVLQNGIVDSKTAEGEHLGRGYKVPNGALYTTVGDLARFVSFEMGCGPAEVLSAEQLLQNRRRIVVSPANLRGGYGIGFMAIRLGDTIVCGHSGEVAGYVAEAYFEPRSKIGMIVLRNAVGGDFRTMNLVRAAFVSTTTQGEASPAPPSAPADKVKEFLGNYPLAPSFVIAITANGDELYAQATNQHRLALELISDDNYAVTGVDAEMSFERDGTGHVVALVLHQNGRDQRAPKLAPGQLPTPPKEIALTPEEAAEYVGHFGEAPYEFTVTQEGDQLSVKFAEQRAAKIYESAKDEFFYKVVNARISFERGPDGKIKGLVLHQNGRDHEEAKSARSN
jgi:CubicO group peptidase (beta-lactamase class C family)